MIPPTSPTAAPQPTGGALPDLQAQYAEVEWESPFDDGPTGPTDERDLPDALDHQILAALVSP
jgi:hypothetical protein